MTSKQFTPTYESTPVSKVSNRHNNDFANHSSAKQRIFNTIPKLNPLYPSSTSMSNLVQSDGNDVSPTRSSGSLQKSNSLSPFASKLAETDASTVQRQRKELQLMINELKERDKELNELVHSHHNQLVAWEFDRQRITNLEQQLSRTKVELRKRHEKCKLLKERLHHVQTGVHSKSLELENTQMHLHQLSEKASNSSSQVEEMRMKNSTLQKSIQDLSNKVSSLQSSEQEASTLLRLKDKDVRDANIRIEELSEKLKSTNKWLFEYKNIDTNLKSEFEKIRKENLNLRDELDLLKRTSDNSNSKRASPEEVANLKETILHLQKELLLAGEREKRKDSLLELSHSRQERTEVELNHLRQLYDSLQKDNITLKEKINYNADDDRFSVVSDYDDKETFPMIKKLDSLSMLSNSTTLLNPHMNQNNASQVEVNCHMMNDSKVADISLASLQSEDIGAMNTAELKSRDDTLDVKPYTHDENSSAINENEQFDSVSPSSRLHKLLEESRKMVESLEKSPTFSSIHPSPERKQNDDFDGYLTPTIGSLHHSLNGST